jgi:hypothetical protein
MKPDWKIDLSIYIAGCIVERIGPNPHGESIFRRLMALGVAALEDKIVQQAVVTVLNEIYEVGLQRLFLRISAGSWSTPSARRIGSGASNGSE